MKEFFSMLVVIMCGVVIFVPWLIGIIDIATWALFGEQLTNIPWEGPRGIVLGFWPVIWLLLLALIPPY